MIWLLLLARAWAGDGFAGTTWEMTVDEVRAVVDHPLVEVPLLDWKRDLDKEQKKAWKAEVPYVGRERWTASDGYPNYDFDVWRWLCGEDTRTVWINRQQYRLVMYANLNQATNLDPFAYLVPMQGDARAWVSLCFKSPTDDGSAGLAAVDVKFKDMLTRATGSRSWRIWTASTEATRRRRRPPPIRTSASTMY